MFEWDDLRVFLAVHRTRSHAAAGRLLRVAPTTIGRRVAALEAAVGARLFTRQPEGLVPTAAAVALAARAERVEAELLDAERELSVADARPTGTVRITCGDGFASYVLAPALPELLTAHPGLSVEVWGDPRSLDLVRGEADIALRHFRPRERSLVARRIGLERTALYASSAYLSARGAPRTLRDLARHDVILYDRAFDRAPNQAWFKQAVGDARITVRANSTTLMHAACIAGAGIAILSSPFVREEPRLERVLIAATTPPVLDVWAVTHAELRTSARVVTTLRWLEQLVARSGFR